MANQPSKYSKFLVGAASAALVASAVAPIASAADFKDTKGNTHEEAINALSDAGIIKGYTDGSFQPNKTLTRSDVVKMMGKWLVAEGKSIPADAVSNPRFTDLTSTSNKELLEYAAVVKDNDVFIGSNGKLLAADNITRENMALVLVRAFDKVNDIDLVAYVAEQDFKKDVKDLSSAKTEAQGAINVLDFFDITNPAVATFNPKGSTTRGQFATFLHKTLNADFSVVSVGAVKAINATTVEVTYEEAVDATNLKASDFTIEGLEVKNAVIKQTDAKTVVLTTAVQVGGKKYTLKAGEATIGTFVGVSAVIPEKITMVTSSVQGTISKEVTVKADINVKAAGVPVTFNITSDNTTGALQNGKLEAVAYTDENGVASYSYTRYYAHDDNVVAYATSKSDVSANAKVYWTQALAITEVTEGLELINGQSKVYKVKGAANSYVKVSFAENLAVTPDKSVDGAYITDAAAVYSFNQTTGVYTKSPITAATADTAFPYEHSTGGKRLVLVKINANGEGTFTLTGSEAAVTPIVSATGLTATEVAAATIPVGTGATAYGATQLQAKAAKVTFALKHTLGLAVVAEGSANASVASGTFLGGRDYTVSVTDKNGKTAPVNTEVLVTFKAGNNTADAVVRDANGIVASQPAVGVYRLLTDNKGQVKFTVTSTNIDKFAIPTVFIDNNANNALNTTDQSVDAEVTYFVAPAVTNAKLSVLNAVNGKETATVNAANNLQFVYQSVDQNGKDYATGTTPYQVTYYVEAVFNDVVVSGNGLPATTVAKGTHATVKVNANTTTGKAVLTVEAANKTSQTDVYVRASATEVSLPVLTATGSFTSTVTNLPNVVPATVATINATKEEITFTGFAPESYTTASFLNSIGAPTSLTKEEFEAFFAGATGVLVKATKQANGTYLFEITSAGTTHASSAAGTILLITNLPVVTDGDYVTKVEAARASYEGLSAGAKAAVSNFAALTTAEPIAVAKKALNASFIAQVDTDYITADQTGPAGATAVLAAANAVLTTATTEAAFVTAKNDLEAALALLTKKVAIDVTKITAALDAGFDSTTGEFDFTFTSTPAVAGLTIDAVQFDSLTSIVNGTVATVTPTGTGLQLKVALVDSSSDAIDLDDVQSDIYVFNARLVGTNVINKNVKITVSYVGAAWVATIVAQ